MKIKTKNFHNQNIKEFTNLYFENFNTYKYKNVLSEYIFYITKNNILNNLFRENLKRPLICLFKDVNSRNEIKYLDIPKYILTLKSIKRLFKNRIQNTILLILVAKIVIPFINSIIKLSSKTVEVNINLLKQEVNRVFKNKDKYKIDTLQITGGNDDDDDDDDKKNDKKKIIKFLFFLLFVLTLLILAFIFSVYCLIDLDKRQNFFSSELLSTMRTTELLRKHMVTVFELIKNNGRRVDEIYNFYETLSSSIKNLLLDYTSFVKKDYANFVKNYKIDINRIDNFVKNYKIDRNRIEVLLYDAIKKTKDLNNVNQVILEKLAEVAKNCDKNNQCNIDNPFE
jgi:hypothetical protein